MKMDKSEILSNGYKKVLGEELSKTINVKYIEENIILPAMEEYAEIIAINFCLHICGKLNVDKKNPAFYNSNPKSNDGFLIMLPATIQKRYKKYIKMQNEFSK